jgi:hypothetical protein
VRLHNNRRAFALSPAAAAAVKISTKCRLYAMSTSPDRMNGEQKAILHAHVGATQKTGKDPKGATECRWRRLIVAPGFAPIALPKIAGISLAFKGEPNLGVDFAQNLTLTGAPRLVNIPLLWEAKVYFYQP